MTTGPWVYRRRFSCDIRYRHGGYNAVAPIAGHTVPVQAYLRDLTIRRLADRPATEARGQILNFAARRARKSARPVERPARPTGWLKPDTCESGAS